MRRLTRLSLHLALGLTSVGFIAAPVFAQDLGTYRPGQAYQSVTSPGADVCNSRKRQAFASFLRQRLVLFIHRFQLAEKMLAKHAFHVLSHKVVQIRYGLEHQSKLRPPKRLSQSLRLTAVLSAKPFRSALTRKPQQTAAYNNAAKARAAV